MDDNQVAIAVAKEEAACTLDEWLRAMKALCEGITEETLDRADQARIAWKVAEKGLAELKAHPNE